MTPPPASSAPSSFTRTAFGLIGFACTLACTRYAKDADKAPTMVSRVELQRMSAAKVQAFEQVADLAQEVGVDVYAAAEPFTGALGDFDERLRPVDWEERLVKTYLTFGLLTDFSMALTNSLPEDVGLRLLEVVSQDRFGGFAANELLEDIAAQRQLAARMGLWGRRVVGEEIGSLLRILARSPELLDGGMGVEQFHAVLSAGATSRMRGLGLRV